MVPAPSHHHINSPPTEQFDRWGPTIAVVAVLGGLHGGPESQSPERGVNHGAGWGGDSVSEQQPPKRRRSRGVRG